MLWKSKSTDQMELSFSGSLGAKVSYLVLHGGVPPNQRQAVVDRFNSDHSIDVLVLTTNVRSLSTQANKMCSDWRSRPEPDRSRHCHLRRPRLQPIQGRPSHGQGTQTGSDEEGPRIPADHQRNSRGTDHGPAEVQTGHS